MVRALVLLPSAAEGAGAAAWGAVAIPGDATASPRAGAASTCGISTPARVGTPVRPPVRRAFVRA